MNYFVLRSPFVYLFYGLVLGFSGGISPFDHLQKVNQ